MACTYVLEIPDIGRVEVLESRRSRAITLKVTSKRVIRVSAPKRTAKRAIASFVVANREWLERVFEKLSKNPDNRIVFTENSDFYTRFHRIKIKIVPENTSLRCKIEDNTFVIPVPAGVDIKSDEVQKSIRRSIDTLLKKEAKEYLPQRVSQLAGIHGFKYNEMAIRNAFSRWGSCNSLGRIMLSCQLMRLPDDMIDYVILHELCHTIEMNHSERFWTLMDKVTGGNAMTIRKKFKKVSTSY